VTGQPQEIFQGNAHPFQRHPSIPEQPWPRMVIKRILLLNALQTDLSPSFYADHGEQRLASG
jgi:hypothetical protein